MLGGQSNISFVLDVAVLCLVKPQILDSSDHSIELLDSRMLSFIKFWKRTPRNNLDTEAGLLFTS